MNMYAMQRANGDWFAMSEAGQLCVPVFSSSSDAMQARSVNSGMLQFKPMTLDDRALSDLRDDSDKNAAIFRLISEPSLNLGRGRLINHEQLSQLSRNGSDKILPGR